MAKRILWMRVGNTPYWKHFAHLFVTSRNTSQFWCVVERIAPIKHLLLFSTHYHKHQRKAIRRKKVTSAVTPTHRAKSLIFKLLALETSDSTCALQLQSRNLTTKICSQSTATTTKQDRSTNCRRYCNQQQPWRFNPSARTGLFPPFKTTSPILTRRWERMSPDLSRSAPMNPAGGRHSCLWSCLHLLWFSLESARPKVPHGAPPSCANNCWRSLHLLPQMKSKIERWWFQHQESPSRHARPVGAKNLSRMERGCVAIELDSKAIKWFQEAHAWEIVW